MNLDPYLIPRKINLKWIMDLNVEDETIRLSDENMEECLYDLGIGKQILKQNSKNMNHKIDFIKSKNFCS